MLLDTHAFLWFIAGDSQLLDYSKHLIEEPSNERILSIASVWEITIKSSLGKLTAPTPSSELIHKHVWPNAIELLPIEPEHLDVLHGLPYHHKDPFDRLMIAQAIHEEMIVITRDSEFSNYDVELAWTEPEPPSSNGTTS